MSNKIEKINLQLINQIAAGEVIERPANIVKELIENAIDAKAEKIIVQIKNGGIDRILVQDDGNGIDFSQLSIAYESHTTSKILNNHIELISTLGFRGEALSSIASVSRVKTLSKPENQVEIGTITIEGGSSISHSKERSSKILNKGTSTEITGLFYNTPVRRKFLKTVSTERKRIIEIITHFSLVYPELHFILQEEDNHGKFKIRLESPARKGILSVIFDIMGHEIANQLIPVKGKIDIWEVEGYISKPNLIKGDRSGQYICVNGRIVKNNELQNVIESAYGSQLMRSSHPVVILKFSGPFDAVDFNVHPQKSEIRFRSDDELIPNLKLLIRKSLDDNTELPEVKASQLKSIDRNIVQSYDTLQSSLVEPEDKSSKEIYDQLITKEIEEDSTINENKVSDITNSEYIQTSLSGDKIYSDKGINVLGHIMNKFGVVFRNNELWLIDIHAADERIKFERFEKESQRIALSQEFLEVMQVSLLPNEKSVLIDNRSRLEKFGLKISDAIANDIFIHSFPVYFDQEINKNTIMKVLSDLTLFLDETHSEKMNDDSPFDEIEYGIVARLACHGSIRSGHFVSNQTIMRVVQELLLCKNPYTCAHGRPTILRMTRARLEGWFKR